MHVKYASRHVLYPVPNVLVAVAVVAARAVLAGVALRDTDTIFFDVPFVAVRAVLGVDALRDTVAVVRAVDVAVRADVVVRAVLRDVPVVRLTVVLLRVVDVEFCPRTSIVFDGVVVRLTFCSLRPAALATPILVQHAAIKSQTFFILVLYMIPNICKSGQGLFQNLYNKKNAQVGVC